MEGIPGQELCQGPEPDRTEEDAADAVSALLRAARSASGSLVTVDADGTTTSQTYPELLDAARRMLTGLREQGLRPGHTVLLCGLPLSEFFPAFWACVLGGARPAAIAEHPAPGSPALDRLLHAARLLDQPLVLGDAAGAAVLARTAPALRVAIARDCLSALPADDHVEPDGSDTAMLMLSSGSTGVPKAARLTHAGLADFAASSRRIMDVRPDHTMVNWLPVDHSGAFLLYHLLAVFTGCTNVHARTDRVLAEPLRWLDLLDSHRAHHSWAPTFAYQLVADALAERPEGRWNLEGLRTMLCGGERIALPVLRRFLDRTARYGLREEHIVPVWGMAETVTAVTYGRLDRPGTVHRLLKSSLGGNVTAADRRTPEDECVTFVASGAPAHGVTLRVVDDRGEILPEGRIGRLQVHSPARLTPGYVNDPEADAIAFPAGRDWLDSGDLAFLNAGQVVITGRSKDVIILNGHNLYCHEVEEAAAAVDGVRHGDVAACGIPDPDSGTETLAVFFVSRDAVGNARITAEVRAALFTRLGLTTAQVLPVPRDEFPRTPAGKVRRAELRDRLMSGGFGSQPAHGAVAKTDHGAVVRQDQEAVARPDHAAVAQTVRDELESVLGRPVDMDRPFYELGLTSLLLIRLRTGIEERIGKPVSRTAFFEHPTVRALAAHLSAPGAPAGGRTGEEHPGGAPAADTADRRVAVIGLSLRFPGADSPERFWANLRDGVDSVRVFSEEELAAAGLTPEQRRAPDLVPVGGVLDGAEEFDTDFFGMSPKETELTHPAHRLFLESCHQALEQGGYAAAGPDTRVGVFAGSGMNLYDHQQAAGAGAPSGPYDGADPVTGMQSAVGRQPDFLATRVAYRLGLTGPAIGVQTACSTSLVAVHLAVQSLVSGESDLALAGAAAVHLPQETGYRSHPGSILSPTGRCRAFDAEADGTVGGNGVAAVLLKRLDRALADGDTVHAVILGSAVNNDGAGKVGFHAPGVAGQVDVVRQALRAASVPGESISYVEAHGTGTGLGDPVELEALGRALGEDTGRTGFCAVGSVKPGIGHLDSCAGMAGLVKTVLMLSHRTLVPTVHLSRPHPEIRLEGGPLTLATELRPWSVPDGVPRRAGVSAFGVGGTNAHVVLEEAPPVARRDASSELPVLVPVSACDTEALDEFTGLLRDRLRQRPQLAAADVAATLAYGRPHRLARTVAVGRTAGELALALEEPRPRPPAPLGPVAFAFSGQGSARRGMASGLYAAYPAARRTLERCAEVHADEFGTRLLPLLLDGPVGEDEVWPTETAQAALFAHQAALADVWRAAGIRPALLLGHSVGEYAALYAAGALTLEDGLRLTARRGRLMHTACPPGGMIAVRADRTAAHRIARTAGVELAAVNGPRAQVLSGAPHALEEAVRLLDQEGVRWRALAVDRAFHSATIEPALNEFRAHAEKAAYSPLRTPLVTSADGEVRDIGWTVDAEYLCRQARQPVRFDLAMAAAAARGCEDFVEIGAGAALTGLGRHCVPASRWLSGQGETGGAAEQVRGLLTGLGSLYRRGADLEWRVLTPGGGRVQLPGHPLRRRAVASPVVRTPERPAAPQVSAVSDDLLSVVRQLTADKVGRQPAAVMPDSSFFELGADSLSLMGMTTELEERFGVRVPVRELFDSADTPRRLAERLAELRDGTARMREAAAPVATADRAPGASPELLSLFDRQLRLAERAVDHVNDVISRQLDMLADTTGTLPPAAAPAPLPSAPMHPVSAPASPAPAREPNRCPRPVPQPAAPAVPVPPAGCDFSLYFFGDYPEDAGSDKYALIMEASDFADRHGFHALWFPERHFNSFGALFPNPSVLAAALAARTSRIRLHAGSVVLPLHHPVRVAEEWSVVDNISGGRAGMCVASGWHATDFALAPENFGRHREVMYEHLETVRRLWSGRPVTTTAGDGRSAEIRLHPRPVQEQLPLYVAVVGNPDSYRRAAAEGLGVVTNLMAQTVEQLADNIALYRRTRAEHGLDPATGRVVVLVHTYLGEDAERARAEAYRPFVSYLRSSLSLFDQVTNSLGFDIDLENTPEEDVEFLLGRAYDRYCASRALIGDEHTVAGTARRLREAGADELACFVDFGVPKDKVLAALPHLDRLRRREQPEPGERTAPAPRRMPLTPAQRRIWFLEQLHPGTRMYHEPKAIRLDGPLDVTALRWALQRVAERQPALRTVFGDREGVPYQEVLDRVQLDCPVDDRTGVTEEEALRAALAAEGDRVLDLGTGPLVSARLLRLSEERHLLFLTAHHIVFDSSSTVVLVRDLAACYRARSQGGSGLPPLPELPPAASPDPAGLAASVDFWRTELAGAPDLDLPTDRPRPPVRSGAGASLTHALDADLVGRLHTFAAAHRATLFMTLTSAIGATLGRFAGQQHVLLGTAVAARPAAADHHVGLFLDTVPLRLDLGGDPDFPTLLTRVRNSSTAAYEHRDIPFDELVSTLNPRRDPGRNPLFQVMVEYENEGEVDFDPPQLSAALLDMPSDRAPFDLSVYLTRHRDGVRFMVEYDTALFDEGTVRRLVEYVEQVLRRALDTPGARLAELTAVTATDRAALARLGHLDKPSTAAEDTLHGLFEQQVRRTPDAVALISGEQHLTYAELENNAGRLAGRLRARGAATAERVAVLLPRGADLITALLAVLKSGAAYLPLDLSLPTPRIAALLHDGAPVLLLTADAALARHPELSAPVPVHLVDEAGDTLPAAPLEDTARPEDPAYCVYTSGSTGRPKGVVVPHRGPVNLIRGHLERHPPLRTLQWTSPAFDVSVQEIFTTLAAGAALVLIDDEVRHDAEALARAVRRHEVQRLFMPCTPMKYLIGTGPVLPSLRELFSAGEALQLTDAFRRFLAAHPRCALYNQYGPTETSVIVTSHRVDPVGEEWPPIGTPVPGARIRLLDGAGREVPVGAVGEIHVGGVPVARGYHARPQETAAAFLEEGPGVPLYRTGDLGRWRAADSTLQYCGRTDDQVKIRGHRVEPGEIQAALTELPGVRDAAVVPRRDRHGDMELLAYVVPATPAADPRELHAVLSTGLPDHLVPRHWAFLERLPVNASGKLDRAALPEPTTGAGPGSGETGAEPATPLEKDLHHLWCEELGIRRIPVNRSFFQLGGHSLSAIRLLHRMRECLDVGLTMTDFFLEPTIRAVAARCGARAHRVVDTAPMPSTLRRLWRRHHDLADPSVYNVAHRIDLHGDPDLEALVHALEDLVNRHHALRSRAVRRPGPGEGEYEYAVEVLADVPVELPVTDLSAQAEDAASVEQWCREQVSGAFAMDRAPLFRFRLARLGPDHQVLVTVFHHAIVDGWSMGVIWRELQASYNTWSTGSQAPLPSPVVQFTDFARSEHGLPDDRRARLERFWRTELDGVALRPALPYDLPRPCTLSGRGALHTWTMDGDLPREVADTAARLSTTPYSVLASAFATWLAGLCGTPGDVVLAASSANRTGRDHSDVVGLLGDAVLLRARTSEAQTFADLVKQLGNTLFMALDHQDLPLTDVVELVSPQTGDALFPTVLFTVVTTPPPALDLRSVAASIRGLPSSGVARNELYVVISPGDDTITVAFEYSTDLFTRTSIERWARSFSELLRRAVSDPECPLGSLRPFPASR